jgi:hypothetical protein
MWGALISKSNGECPDRHAASLQAAGDGADKKFSYEQVYNAA